MTKKQENSNERNCKTVAISIGVVSGIIASLCCLGPVFIILLGLSSLSVAISITQYNPYFLILSFIFMAGAIWVYLRKKNQGCCNLNVIKKNRNFISLAAITMVLFYVVALYVLLPAITPHIYGIASKNVGIQTSEKLRQVTLEIYGITCPSCVNAIESLLKQKEGVVNASFNYFQGIGEVVYDPSKITIDDIVKAIQPYRVTLIEDKEFSRRQETAIQSFVQALPQATYTITETSVKTDSMTTTVATETSTKFPKAPSFQLREYGSDRIVMLEDFKGKPVFLEFFSPYCPVCLSMIPKVEQLYEKYRDKIVFVIISYGDVGEVKDIYGIKPIILVDDGKVFAKYGVRSVPKFYILDREHRIIWSGAGKMDIEELELALRSIFKTE
jgi:thiol-disulfide isomerase/thioredoxin